MVLAGMERWMEEHEYVSVKQMRGSMSMVNIESPAAFLRGNYLKMLGSYTWREPGNGAGDVLKNCFLSSVSRAGTPQRSRPW